MSPVDCIELPDGVVHIWPLHLDAPDGALAEFERLLSIDERERAAGLQSEESRRTFLMTRVALRILLSRYLNASPESIVFAYGANGKPAIAANDGIDFNLSHSGRLVAYAFTRGCEIGIDVEAIRPIAEMGDVARRFFSSEETDQLISLPPNQQERAFFECWTRRESYIKATGGALSMPKEELRVSFGTTERASFLRVPSDHRDRAWALHNLDLDPDHASAIAYAGAPRRVHTQPSLTVQDLRAFV